MEQTELKVQFLDGKLDALRYFLEKKDSTVEDELRDHLDKTYEKVVPPQVREFVEHHGQQTIRQENRTHQAPEQDERQPRAYHRRQHENTSSEITPEPLPDLQEADSPDESESQSMSMGGM